jgi:sugar transferase (PEP-CTERM system associated)
VKLFGHHVTRLFVVLAGLDTAVFLTALSLLGRSSTCRACELNGLLSLNPLQALLLTAVFLLITTSVGLYNTDAVRDFRTFLKRFVLASQLIFIPTLVALAVSKAVAGLPFGWHVGMLSLAIALFMGVLFTLHLVLSWCLGLPFMKRRILVLGEGQYADAIVEYLKGPGRSHFHHTRTISSWRPAGGAPRLGNLLLKVAPEERLSLWAVAEHLRADEIVVAVDDRRGLPVSELLECKLQGVAIVDALTFWEREAGQIDPVHAGVGWLTFSGGFAFDRRHRVVKRASDLVIAAAFLLAVLPLALLTALAIRIESRGPIFYRQERVGLNGRIFRVWKFRSMRVDAEGDGVPRWAQSTDDRVTRVGRFIRKARIDEIPQAINVLVGDMSFIGPRPERPFFVEQLREQIPHYDLRHRVRPGITGWAQVNYPYGASAEDATRKLAYDLYYLKKNDLLLDFAILVQTVRVVLFAHGAR